MAPPQISVIIPNYCGRALLAQNLPGVLEACEAHGGAEVLVVDDGSTDESVALLAERFPGVRLLRREEQQGFIASVNEGVAASAGEVVVLLNTDVAVEPDFLGPLAEALAGETFAVSACSLTEDGQDEGLSRAFFEEGDLLVVQPGIEAPDRRHDQRCTNFHASGGFSAFQRERFLELGGLDPIYHPFYWEDVDLCFRAWKRGWRVLHEPRSRVHHRAHGTISCYFAPDEVKEIYERNKHAFILKNISDEGYLEAYFQRLSRLLFQEPVSGEERRATRGAFDALRRLRAVLERRPRGREEALVTDADVLARSANVPC